MDSYAAVSYKEVAQYKVKMKTLSGGQVCPPAVSYKRRNRQVHSPKMYTGEDNKTSGKLHRVDKSIAMFRRNLMS
jgi:hypothetical protein